MNMMNLLIFFIYIQLNFGKINNEEEEKFVIKCMDLYDSRCLSLDTDELTRTVMIGNICPNDMICEFICRKKFTELFIGSKCNYNQECFSNKCENNVCVSVPNNCTNDFGCDPGSYCNEEENKCKKMGQKNDNCTHDEIWGDDFFTTDEDIIFGNCSYGFVCNNNKCVEIGSLEDGTGSDNNFACKNFLVHNGVCTEIIPGDMDKYGYCQYSPKNEPDITLKYECPISISDGKPINIGKDITKNWNDFVKTYNKVLKTIDKDKFIRKADFNNKLFLENKDLIYSVLKLGLFGGIYDIEENCLLDYIYNTYIYKENKSNNGNNIKISNIYFISLIILLI
jgi:hypothetical protein